jgi:hypothetical protein
MRIGWSLTLETPLVNYALVDLHCVKNKRIIIITDTIGQHHHHLISHVYQQKTWMEGKNQYIYMYYISDECRHHTTPLQLYTQWCEVIIQKL